MHALYLCVQVLYRLHPALVLASAHPTASEAGGAAAVEGSDPAHSPSEAEDEE